MPLRVMLRRFFGNFAGKLRRLAHSAREEGVFFILFLVIIIALLSGILLAVLEQGRPGATLADGALGVWQSVWWAFVSMTTTGFGDQVPVTIGGQFIGILTMFSGICVTALITATVTSIFVERKIRAGKGLEDVYMTDHVIICGWSHNGDRILEGINDSERKDMRDIVLVNELADDIANDIISKYSNLNIKFVRGDFTKDNILRRAEVKRAKMAILIADSAGEKGYSKADDRTIVSALAIKTMNHDIGICAELLSQDNELHLRRVGVEEVIVSSEYGGFLMANAALAPSIPTMVKELLSSKRDENMFRVITIPTVYVGATFAELAAHIRQTDGAITIAIISSEEGGIRIDDILTDDTSFIDAFIKKKFTEVEDDYFEKGGLRERIAVNPPDNYVIKANDSAVVIARR